VSNPTRKILKIAYIQNYNADSDQILHSDKDHQVRFVGDPNTRKTNTTWRMAAIIKIEKSRYIRNGLTDVHKIWHGDAHWFSVLDWPLKFTTFINAR